MKQTRSSSDDVDIKEYMHLLPDGEGQVHVNHVDCPAGLDKKRRLYIRRKSDGSVVYFCHHCGASGRYVTNKFSGKKAGASLAATLRGTGNIQPRLPADFSVDEREWPAKARAWLYKYQLSSADIKRGKIGYSESLGRLILPQYDSNGLKMYQSRIVYEDKDTLPKYMTYGSVNDTVALYERDISTRGDTIVLVEDVVSALRCSKYYDTIALLGAHMHDSHVKSILTHKYKSGIVYLDMDNPHIKSQALTMKRKLDMILDQVRVIHAEKDPKECGSKELESILTAVVLDTI